MKHKYFSILAAIVSVFFITLVHTAWPVDAAPKTLGLITTAPADLSLAGTTKILTFTRKTVVTNVILRVTSGLTSQAASIQMGTSPSHNDWLSSVELYGVDRAGIAVELNRLHGTLPQKVFDPGETLWLEVQNPAEMGVELDVFGYEI